MTTEIKEVQIGTIANYYGHLLLRRIGQEHYQWGIENHSNMYWEEIPLFLVDALINFEEQRKEKENEN